MKRSKYLETRRGQLGQLRKRHLRRFHFTIEQEPQSKNIKASDAVAFQQSLLKDMKSIKKAAYTGDVFLQMEFFTKSKTPPAIYTLPKNYLDLLDNPRPDSGISRKHLLYRDDRQIKALIVRYHLDGQFAKPMIWLTAEPFRDFRSDLDLLDRIRSDRFIDERGDSSCEIGRDLQSEPFSVDDSGLEDEFESVGEFAKEQERWKRLIGTEAYENQMQMMRLHLQQSLLKRTDHRTCQNVLSLFGPLFHPADRDKLRSFKIKLSSSLRQVALSSPFVIEVHHAPYREGDTAAFRQSIRTELEKLKKREPILFPLLSLLNVTILMVPPEQGGKDLDNLARLILPEVHAILLPPSHIARVLPKNPPKSSPDAKTSWIDSHWESILAALPKEPKYSVTEYRVFEIPRFTGDPKEGIVRLAFGNGFTPIRFREEIDDLLDQWKDAQN